MQQQWTFPAWVVTQQRMNGTGMWRKDFANGHLRMSLRKKETSAKSIIGKTVAWEFEDTINKFYNEKLKKK